MGSNLLLFNRFIHERQRRFHFCTGSPRFFSRFSLVPKGKCSVTSDDFQFPPLEEISETLPLGGPFVTLLFYLGLTLKAAFPVGSNRAALLLGVQIYSFTFYLDLTLRPKDLCITFMMDGRWGPTILVFKSFDSNLVYSLGIDLYVQICESVQ